MDGRPAITRLAAGMVVATLVLTPAGALAAGEGTGDSRPASHVANEITTVLGGEPLLLPENARVTRYDDRVEFEIRMPTPVPGTYVYPDTVAPERHAAPEFFTVWAVVFNHPEHCASAQEEPRCGGDDFNDDVRSSGYNIGAYMPSVAHQGGAFVYDAETGGQMIMRGTIAVGQPAMAAFPPGDEPRYPLENPHGAEFHIAIAPHGQVDPATFAFEMYEPAGNPTCGCLWVAFFSPDAGG